LRESYILRAPMNVFLQLEQQVDDLTRTIKANTAHQVELKKREFAMASGKLAMLSPLAVLQRGYSITFKEEKVVKDIAELKRGDLLRTRFVRGHAFSKVEKLDPSE
jgi:exodeoxyribonuclease VII large subunit